MSSAPKVAVLGPVPPWRSGIADQTVRLARALVGLGVPPLVVTFTRLYPETLYPGVSDRGDGDFPTDLDVRARLDGLNPLSFRRAAQEVKEAGATVAFVPWWTAFFAPHIRVLLDALSPMTRVLLCHNVFDHEGGAVKRLVTRAALLRADAFAVQNRRNLRELEEIAPGRPVALVPHPAEPVPRLVSRGEARARLGIEPEGDLFLFSGLLRPYKGWDVLLEAWPAVRATHENARLVLAGEPWGEARSLLRAAAPVGVTFVPRYLGEEERHLWFDASDAVVCPYRHATGSGIAADALGHGRPVIGTTVDGLLDVVKSEVSGLLVPPDDAGALAAAMARFLDEGLGPRLSRGAEERRACFTPESHARRLLLLGGLER